MIETIHHNDSVIAIIIYKDHHTEGIEFITPQGFSLQLGSMTRPAGYKIIPHIHNPVRRETHIRMGLVQKKFTYITLHRPSNVDNRESLERIVDELIHLAGEIPIVFSIHPRTRKKLMEFDLLKKLNGSHRIGLSEPLEYHDSICLTRNAKFVLTDSGGLQEETTYLKTPCLTLRPNTERPVTVREGTNKLTDLDNLGKDFDLILKGTQKEGKIPELWDGKAARRIVNELSEHKN